jgi:Holliday junction resolvase
MHRGLINEDTMDFARTTRLEQQVERAFIKRARDAGFLVRKMNGSGFRGWPDVLVEGKHGHWYIEFKAPGRYKNVTTGLSQHQVALITQLRALGKKVLVTDSENEAWEFINDSN